MNSKKTISPSSFRDPSGFVFFDNGVVQRQVNNVYRDDYEQLMSSGLYSVLVNKGLIVSHEEVPGAEIRGSGFKVIKPEQIPFISHPYEWSFGQLKDAALLTLEIQKISLTHGMTLKDANAYNVQFVGSSPKFIDTLSFAKYRSGEPWIAYRQFSEHFLAPLALMAYCDLRLAQLFMAFPNGIPLDLACRMLPKRARLRPSLLMHVFMHASFQSRYQGTGRPAKGRSISKNSLLGIIDSLAGAVRGLARRRQKTVWADYYEALPYSKQAFEHKQKLVREMLEAVSPEVVWDLGANTGIFSRIASGLGSYVLSFDMDPLAVERNYEQCIKNGDKKVLPLLIDLANPSPGIGWRNEERVSLIARGPADAALALGLVHHLAIGNNVPLEGVALLFRDLCKSLIVEFVPKSDSQVKVLLSSREDIFSDYSESGFEEAFGKSFRIERKEPIENSQRVLYLMLTRE